MTVERWESRLDRMDHSRGTTDKMRKQAMLAEIKQLREALADPEKAMGALVRAHKAEMRTATRLLTAARRRAKEAQKSASVWRSRFADLRKLLLKVKVE
jgi:hypothetical protein